MELMVLISVKLFQGHGSFVLILPMAHFQVNTQGGNKS